MKTSPHHHRVEAVFNGQYPDRIPICEQAFASSVASQILGRAAQTGSTELHYEESLAWLRGDQAHEEFVAQIFEDIIALHRALDLDILFLPWRLPDKPTKLIDRYTILYGDPSGNDWCLRKFDPESHTFGVAECGCPSLSMEEVVRDIKAATAARVSPVKSPLDPFLLRAIREYGQEFVVAGSSGMGIDMQSSGWLEATALEPELIGEYLDLHVEINLTALEVQQAAGIWLINGGGDFAFNSGPIYSPRFFETIMAPRWKRLFDKCRELDMAYIMRSDGNLWPVAQSLFGWAKPHAYYECDYDAGMRFADLRRAFPDLVLMGNVSCPLLHQGTPREIRDQTHECLAAAAPRVIAASANCILHGTPVKNVMALYETATKFKVAPPAKLPPSAEGTIPRPWDALRR